MYSFQDIIAARRHKKRRETLERELASLSTVWGERIASLYAQIKSAVLDSDETNISAELEISAEELTPDEVEMISHFISARRELDTIDSYSLKAFIPLAELEESISILTKLVEHEGMEFYIWTKRKLVGKTPVLVSIRFTLSV